MSHTDKTRPWAVRAEDPLEERSAWHDHLRFGKPVYRWVDLRDTNGEFVTWRTIRLWRDLDGRAAGQWRVEWHGGDVSWHDADDVDWFVTQRASVKSWGFALFRDFKPPFYGYPTVYEDGSRVYHPESEYLFDQPVRRKVLDGYMLDFCTCRYPAPEGTPERFLPCSWVGRFLRFSQPNRFYDPQRTETRVTLSEAARRYNTVLTEDDEGEDGLWDAWEDKFESPASSSSTWWD